MAPPPPPTTLRPRLLPTRPALGNSGSGAPIGCDSSVSASGGSASGSGSPRVLGGDARLRLGLLSCASVSSSSWSCSARRLPARARDDIVDGGRSLGAHRGGGLGREVSSTHRGHDRGEVIEHGHRLRRGRAQRHLAGELPVALGAPGLGVVDGDRLAESGRLGKADRSRDDDVVDEFTEVPLDLLRPPVRTAWSAGRTSS